MKRFVALARVSSREQEREGFSLEVQEEAIRRYAASVGGEITRLFRIAETASKHDERKTFRELMAYAKAHAETLDGLVFYKVDRAARNLFDYVELERLESEHGLPFISISQPTENTPAGRMMRRTLANMSAFYTEQQAVDVKEGQARRVKEGWFCGTAPYGYTNVRKDGRGVVEVNRREADSVVRVFQLYAYENLTLDALQNRLHKDGVLYRDATPRFSRSKLYGILIDRAYIGEVRHRGQWYPGKHEPIVDRATFDRAQALLGGHAYRSHEMTYAGEWMTCGHCGRPVTGERKTKTTKTGNRDYTYYRCSGYTAALHPRVRVREAEIDRQVLALFDKIKIQDAEVRDWFLAVLKAQTRESQADDSAQRAELQRQTSLLAARQDRLLNLHLDGGIDDATFAAKSTEMRDRVSAVRLQLDVLERSHDETADLACKVFELSQTLRERWDAADFVTKRRILEILCLNCRLDGATLVPEMRKPFDLFVEGLSAPHSRGGGI